MQLTAVCNYHKTNNSAKLCLQRKTNAAVITPPYYYIAFCSKLEFFPRRFIPSANKWSRGTVGRGRESDDGIIKKLVLEAVRLNPCLVNTWLNNGCCAAVKSVFVFVSLCTQPRVEHCQGKVLLK